ncbi:MAG: BlaI/MecI/CopY family transcriptional regulator [Akkermansiaceae bacterium]|nr:BlaI/MecI/CopY family transcriptional regulator [Akkermansiaceae bacterium]
MIAKAELAILDLLWEHGHLTAREIREQLYPNTQKPQHGTVQRLLQRLEKKGYLSRDRSHSIHFFAATLTRQDYAGLELESLADTLTAGSFTPLITHLVENKRISTDEIDKLRALLDEHTDQ